MPSHDSTIAVGRSSRLGLSMLLAATLVVACCASEARARAPRAPAVEEAWRLLREEQFEPAAAAFERLVDANPYDGGLSTGHGFALHKLGRGDRAIRAFLRAAELGWQPSANYYNVACVHALAGRRDEAITWVARALDAGFAEQETLETDTDMDSLRGDERFIDLTGLRPPEDGRSRDERWRYDLDFFARRMKQMHWDLYGRVSREQFHGEIDRLKRDVPTLKDHQVLVRLMRIVASVGDGHTRLRLSADPVNQPVPRLPVRFYQFPDGLYITRAASDQADLLGAKVVRLGALDASAAMEAVKPYCSVDNPMGYLADGPSLLELPWILEAIGAASDDKGVELTVRRRDGDETTTTLRPITVKPDDFGTTFRPAHERAGAPPIPLYLRGQDDVLRREYLPERKLVYFRFAGVGHPTGSTFEQFVTDLFAFIRDSDAQYLVIDMRLNGGGDTGLVMPLIHGLVRDQRVNRAGHLFVITGRNTFSAAVNTVSLIEHHTHATFVGEPPGSPPNFVGESTYFTLPYHRNRVSCSSRYWQFVVSVDRRQWVPPQIAVSMTSDDYLANRDPVMDAIFVEIDRARPTPATTAPTTAASTNRQ